MTDIVVVVQANRWCAQGVELLASQPLEKSATAAFAEETLKELETFLAAGAELGAGNAKDLRSSFKDVIVPETRALVQQVRFSFSTS